VSGLGDSTRDQGPGKGSEPMRKINKMMSKSEAARKLLAVRYEGKELDGRTWAACVKALTGGNVKRRKCSCYGTQAKPGGLPVTEWLVDALGRHFCARCGLPLRCWHRPVVGEDV
jgi:hypothetical protein